MARSERILVVARSRDEANRLRDVLRAAGVPGESVRCLAAGDPVGEPLPPLGETAVVVSGELLGDALEAMFPDAGERVLHALPEGRTVEQAQLIESAIAQARDAVVIVDGRTDEAGPRVVYANQRFCDITSVIAGEALGRPVGEIQPWIWNDPRLNEAIRAGRAFDGDLQAVQPDGQRWVAEVHLAPVYGADGSVSHFVLLQRDVTEQKRVEAHLEHLAHHDALTGLPNRKLFADRLEQAIQHSDQEDLRLGVLFVDLDRFKDINDRLGHPVGDRVLRAVADRIRSIMRGSDTVARLGGDEFTVLLNGLTRAEDAETVARKLLNVVGAPMRIEGHVLEVTPSIGVAIYPDHGRDPDLLLRHADHAMYVAKALGRARCALWHPDMNTDDRSKLRDSVTRAIDDGELALCFQPVVDGATGTIRGGEALLRLRQDGRLVPPSRFLSVLAETGREQVVGEWVLARACEAAAAWQGSGPVDVTVNLSVGQLLSEDLVDTVMRRLDAAGLAPERLSLDVPEPMLLEHGEAAVERLRALRQRGVQVNIDDFGTGHLSLHHLGLLPVDTVKVDPWVVHQVDTGSENLVRAMTALGAGLGLRVVAEGVETAEQRDALLSLGLCTMQGHLFGHPMSPEAFAALVRKQKTP